MVQYDSAALQDLIDIFDYLLHESQSHQTATRYIQKIEQKCQLIGTQPYIGRVRKLSFPFEVRSLSAVARED